MTLRKTLRVLPIQLILILTSAVVVFPVLWMVSSAIKGPQDLFSEHILLIPHQPTLQNFLLAWNEYGVGYWFMNSTITAVGVMVGQILTSILAAYAFGMFNFRGRNVLFLLFLGSMIVPFQVTMIPNYILISQMGLLNTWWAVILPNLPNAFGVFLLRQHFLTFPRDLFDAAKLDGASSWGTLWRIVVPLAKASISALTILFLLDAWNMYFWPLLVLTEPLARTVPIGLMQFIDHEMGHRWGPFMATATMVSVPPLIAYILAQKQIVSAYITSGLKG
jgi:sn-glycerol 3-phosphate transport system permease protein